MENSQVGLLYMSMYHSIFKFTNKFLFSRTDENVILLGVFLRPCLANTKDQCSMITRSRTHCLSILCHEGLLRSSTIENRHSCYFTYENMKFNCSLSEKTSEFIINDQ